MRKKWIIFLFLLSLIPFLYSCSGKKGSFTSTSFSRAEGRLISVSHNGKSLFSMPLPGFCPEGGDVVNSPTLKGDKDAASFSYSCKVGENEIPVKVTFKAEKDRVSFKVTAENMDKLDPEKRYLYGYVKLHKGEHIWGLGENFDSIDNVGFKRPMQFSVAPWSESGLNEVHLPIPFYISSKGYGLFVSSYSEGEWDIGASHRDLIIFSFYSSELTGYIFFGKPYEIVKKYVELTGKPALPPKWGFGILWWRDEYYSEDEIMDDIDHLRALDVPLSVVWIDAPWETGHNTYDYNPAQFPDPWGMIRRMRKKGVITFNWITEHINNPESDPATKPYFLYGEQHNYFVADANGSPLVLPWGRGNGAIIDFTNPEAAAWWRSLIEKPLMVGGYGFKLDYGEDVIPYLSIAKGNRSHLFMYHFFNGKDETQMHAYYKFLYHKNAMEACRNVHGMNCFLIARTGTIGDQKNVTAIWPGDLDNNFSWSTVNWNHSAPDGTPPGKVGGLKAAILAGINLNMVGFPFFGSDTGGYRGGTPEKEVMARWIEFEAFSPIFQYGGDGDRRPWVVYDEELTNIFVRYTRLYVKMFPYIYTQALKALNGVPIMKSISMEYPEDRKVWNYPFEYIFGDTILVAPVVNNGETRPLYLPEGLWYDMNTGELIKGPREIKDYSAPLDVIPHFARGGSIMYLKKIPQTFIISSGYIDLADVENKVLLNVFALNNFSQHYYNGVEVSFQFVGRNIGYLILNIPNKINLEKVTVILPTTSGNPSLIENNGGTFSWSANGNKLEIIPETGYYKFTLIWGRQ